MSTKKRKSFLGGLSSPRHPPVSSAGGLPAPTTATYEAQRTASNPIKAAFNDLIPRGRRFFSAEFWKRKKEEETLQQRPPLSQYPPPPAPTEGRRPSTALPLTLRPPPQNTPRAPEREDEQNDDWETQSDTAYESLRISPRTERAGANDVFVRPVDAPRTSKVWGKAHRATKSLVPPRLVFVSETPPHRGTSAEESLEVLLARNEELRPPISVLGEEMWNASAPNLSPERRVDKRSSATIRHDTLPPLAFGVSKEFARRLSTASTIKPIPIPTPITTSTTKDEYSSSVSSNPMTPSTLAQDRESDSDISDWDASASEDEDSSTLKPSLRTRSEYAGMLRGGGHERAKSTSFAEGGTGTGSFTTASESWDEDFDIAPSSPLSGQSESEEEDSTTLQQPRRPMTARSTTIPGDRAHGASGKEDRGSVKFSVPTIIVERQASLRGHLSNVKEFAKLVEELKTLLTRRHAYRDGDEEGEDEDDVLWAEVEAVLDLASTDPETSTPRSRPRPRTSPPSLSSSTTSVATSTSATTSPDLPLDGGGGNVARRVDIKMDARSVMGKLRGRAYTVNERVHVDTETLPGLVEYVRGLRQRLVVSLGEV
ncbi:hypothetical protein YB2330_005661 [Saitoella coloradoensis]